MTAKITFFPVDNGDMTLIRLADTDATSLLIDMNIRVAADDPNDDTRDVAADLRSRLSTDSNNRPYVDGLLLSHPDKDHCTGLAKHFWLGSLGDYPDDKKVQDEKRIVIREMMSSPMVFRRASKNHTLCEDAKAFDKEARRRVKVNREKNFVVASGDRIRILGEDENGKTDDLGPILTSAGDRFSGINGSAVSYFSAHLLAPISKQDDEAEEVLSKNNSSVILNLEIAASAHSTTGSKLLVGGDAEVEIWERVWSEYQPSELKYDLLQAPHHCSWHSLSYDSWSEKGDEVCVSDDARSALGQAEYGAFIVASSKAVLDDDVDPPCIRAKREYLDILDSVDGTFYCTADHSSKVNSEPLEFEVTASGIKKALASVTAAASVVSCRPPRAG